LAGPGIQPDKQEGNVRHSESIAAIAKALAAAQAEYVTVPKNKTAKIKTKTGSDYSYNYADLADCLAMALPRLSKHGIAFSQPHVIFPDGLRVVTFLLHESGEWMASDGIAISEAGEPQQFGAESTYFRRYDGCSFIGVAPDEDTDAQGAGKRTPKAVTPGSVISLQPPQATGALQPTQQTTQRAAAPPAAAQGFKQTVKRAGQNLVFTVRAVKLWPAEGTINASMNVAFTGKLLAPDGKWTCEHAVCWHASLFDLLQNSVGKLIEVFVTEKDKDGRHFVDINDVVAITDENGEYVEYLNGKPVVQGEVK
jgi:hypothetical protein